MNDKRVRIDGWKAIAAHFNRNRSTVIRWAEAGEFPIRRLPGKTNGSVWAYADELDAWLINSHASTIEDEAETQGAAPVATPSSRRLGRRRGLGIAAGALAAILGLAVISPQMLKARPGSATSAHSHGLPADPALAQLYLQARDDWATRSPEGIARATAELGEVITRDPGFSPAYAGLADVYLVAREYTAMPDSIAFSKAEAAAKLALSIDPDSAEANRDMGFIWYWRDGDLRAAQDRFQRSLRIEPNSTQTHFWLGNILGSAGLEDEALAELGAARRQDPGSTPVELAFAWTLWRCGPGDRGLAQIKAMSVREPQLSLPHKYLSLIYLSKGDVPNYLDQSQLWAAVQHDAALDARLAAEQAAFKQGRAIAVLKLIAQRPPNALFLADARTGSEWPATAASLLGQRDQLLQILVRAESAGEHWSTWRSDQIRYAKWNGDEAILSRLKRLGARHGSA